MSLPPVPAIVVSLPAHTIGEAREQIREAAASGGDLAEIRFDRWTPDERRRAADLFPSPLPLVATLRSRSEGGEGPDDPRERAETLGHLCRLPFRWVDLERARDREEALSVPAENLGRIVSVHRLGPGPHPEWAELLREPPAPGTLRKVVVDSSVGTLLAELLPAIPPAGEGPVVALTTGSSGPLLRAWSRRLGFPMVFASLPATSLRPGAAPSPVEAAQVPVDRLRPFLEAGDEAPAFGLAGHPVDHSLSPALHARWMRAAGTPGLYVPLDFVSEEEFVECLLPLAERGFRGLNVTHPLKSAALEAATEVAPGAAACGVANCLTFREGTVEADNTDLAAILRRSDELRQEGAWDGRHVTVIGTGGAARATLAAARTVGARRRVVGRNLDRVTRLAREFGADRGGEPFPPDGLVVHATTVGRDGSGPLEVPLEPYVGRGTYFLDWVYRPDTPSIRRAVAGAGGVYEDGTRLLIYQAAASFGIWWGEEPDPEVLSESLEEAGCAE